MEPRKLLLQEIVALDYPRILSRLRSKHATISRKTEGKKPLVVLLENAIHQLPARAQNRKARLPELRSRAAELAAFFHRFEALSRNDATSNIGYLMIADIVESAHKLTLHGGLTDALQRSTILDPSLAEALPIAIRKVGRYYRISRDLIDAARNPKYTIFQTITVETLDPPKFDQAQIRRSQFSFDETLRRIRAPSCKAGLLPAARQKFNSRLNNCNTPWKAHAEIQLLFFYELNPEIRRPRMLCSSKSACYLCSLFIEIHGQFHVARTHGRLYDRWLLPEWSRDGVCHESLQSTISKFDEALKANIRSVLNRRKTSVSYPNESVTGSNIPWSSCATLPCEVQPHVTRTSSEVLQEYLQSLDDGSGALGIRASHSSQETLKAVSLRPSSPSEADRVSASTENSTNGSESNEIPSFVPLIKDKWTYHELLDPTLTVHTRSEMIHLYITYDHTRDNDKLDGRNPQTCWVGLKLLDFSGAYSWADVEKELCDLDLLTSEETVLENGAARNSEALWIRKANDLLVVKFAFDHPPGEVTLRGQSRGSSHARDMITHKSGESMAEDRSELE